jgi:ribosomal protein L37E
MTYLEWRKHEKRIPRHKTHCKTCGKRHYHFQPTHCTKEGDANTA